MANGTTNPNYIELIISTANSGDLPPAYDDICGEYAVIGALDSVNNPNVVKYGVQNPSTSEDPNYTRLVAPGHVANVYDTLATTGVRQSNATSDEPVPTYRSKCITWKVVLLFVTVVVLCIVATFLATFFTIGTSKETTPSRLSNIKLYYASMRLDYELRNTRPTSDEYREDLATIKDGLTGYFQESIDGFHEVNVKSLTRGSTVVEYSTAISNAEQKHSAESFSKAILHLASTGSITIGKSVKVLSQQVQNKKITSDTTACSLLRDLGECPASHTCVVVDKLPKCSVTEGWDPVEHVVKKILFDTTLTVPRGVTKVDVICIGGGGGGRDAHPHITNSNAYGGDGGTSSFGSYLRAEGGKGAKEDNTGGEGGHGTVADGGQGGIGGGTSAGAGAAGQTSGGGGGLVPGSSTYLFCGAGGSSATPLGKSGPGGVDPIGRAGGLYGGGGGSRAGGRAGGGGGYSRKVVHVTPGEKIDITVGKAGFTCYAKSGQGIVVVSWGGPIDLDLQITTPLFTKSTITATTETPTTVTSCLNSKDCWVKYNFQFEDNWNDCHGDQYVKKTSYTVGKYVGVVLCSSIRYKLFMADSLTDVFLNIGDRGGYGQDHCEFIGASNDATSIDGNFWESPGTTGYRRSKRGQTPSKGRIGGGTGPAWTGQYYGKWMECGVSIPGNSHVVLWTEEEDTTTTHLPVTTVTYPANWDKVEYTRKLFLDSKVFTVPSGVSKVDVICIGGGGGGRDAHSHITKSNAYGGDGGTSSFGSYLRAEGGKGAKEDNTGGEGGHGTVADGGQGGIGGGTSAGAGAAGQTSGGGGGLVPGSSTYPFCGAGGSSATPLGKSGPGGVDPVGRAGGLYGGGGGSRAGGRAGGGGGYSRKVVQVTPGEKIDITVGKAGSPSYANAGRGIVVVSWGGPIDLLDKTTTDPTTATTITVTSIKTTTSPAITTTVEVQYDGCLIERNKEARGIPLFGGRNPSSVYSCVNKSSVSLSPEVHVLGCYENINRRPPQAGVTIVEIVGTTSRPVVLVLTTYEPVAWQVKVPAGVTIQKIIVFAYYQDESSVTVTGGSNPPVEKREESAYGYGSDNGGGHTDTLLKTVQSLFGHVTSFSGTYKVDHWSLTVGN